MIVINPWLALIALAPTPLVVFTAARYNRLSRPALQEVQQRIAELTAEAEESISGHPDRQGLRPRGAPAAGASAAPSPGSSTRASTRPGCRPSSRRCIGLLPQLGIALVLLIGGREVIAGNLSLGDFTAFYTYLVDPRRADADAGHGDGHGAAGDRLRQPPLRDPRPGTPGSSRHPARRHCRPAAGGWRCAM